MATALETLDQAQSAKDKRGHYARGEFYDRKVERTEKFLNMEFGWKLRACVACNGSGRYDNTGSPACECCHGTGKESCQSEKAWQGPAWLKMR